MIVCSVDFREFRPACYTVHTMHCKISSERFLFSLECSSKYCFFRHSIGRDPDWLRPGRYERERETFPVVPAVPFVGTNQPRRTDSVSVR